MHSQWALSAENTSGVHPKLLMLMPTRAEEWGKWTVVRCQGLTENGDLTQSRLWCVLPCLWLPLTPAKGNFLRLYLDDREVVDARVSYNWCIATACLDGMGLPCCSQDNKWIRPFRDRSLENDSYSPSITYLLLVSFCPPFLPVSLQGREAGMSQEQTTWSSGFTLVAHVTLGNSASSSLFLYSWCNNKHNSTRF